MASGPFHFLRQWRSDGWAKGSLQQHAATADPHSIRTISSTCSALHRMGSEAKWPALQQLEGWNYSELPFRTPVMNYCVWWRKAWHPQLKDRTSELDRPRYQNKIQGTLGSVWMKKKRTSMSESESSWKIWHSDQRHSPCVEKMANHEVGKLAIHKNLRLQILSWSNWADQTRKAGPVMAKTHSSLNDLGTLF